MLLGLTNQLIRFIADLARPPSQSVEVCIGGEDRPIEIPGWLEVLAESAYERPISIRVRRRPKAVPDRDPARVFVV